MSAREADALSVEVETDLSSRFLAVPPGKLRPLLQVRQQRDAHRLLTSGSQRPRLRAGNRD